MAATPKGNLTLALVSETHFGAFGTLIGAVPLAKKYGGKFDGPNRRWCFPLACYAEFEADLKAGTPAQDFEPVPRRVLAAVTGHLDAVRKDVSPDEAFTLLQGRIPRAFLEQMKSYQRAGVISAVQRNGRVLIGDEMGLGKTLQALAVALYYRNEWPCLVVCPSSLREIWAREAKIWLNLRDAEIQILQSKKMAWLERGLTIVSYEVAKCLEGNASFRVVICDECHYLKTVDAARTNYLKPIVTQAKRAIFISGTPALSRPIELFSPLNMLAPQHFPSHADFGKRFCNGHKTNFGWDFNGASYLDELHVLLSKTVMIRRLKSECMRELPAKTRLQVVAETDGAANKILSDLSAKFYEVSDKIRGGQTVLEAERSRLNHLLYLEAGKAKLPSAKAHIRIALQKGAEEKVLVFAHHSDILVNELDAFLTSERLNFIRIDGKTPQNNRQTFCDRFQTLPDCRVALLGLTAAGVGLTLHAATNVLFAELFWNPGQLLQAEDRAHRVGQHRTVEIKYLICPGSLDEVQWRLINKKLKVVGESVNGASGRMQCDDEPDATAPSSAKSAKASSQQRHIDEYFWKLAEAEDGQLAATAAPGTALVPQTPTPNRPPTLPGSAGSMMAAAAAVRAPLSVTPIAVRAVGDSAASTTESPRRVVASPMFGAMSSADGHRPLPAASTPEPAAKRARPTECAMCGEILSSGQVASHQQQCLAGLADDIFGDDDG